MRFSRMRGEDGRLERDLRAERPEPRADFLLSMSKEVTKARAPRQKSRVAFALALTTFIVGAFASFGGVGYAASGAVSAVHVVKKAVAHQPRSLQQSSAQAQYGPVTPPESNTAGEQNQLAGGTEGQVATAGQLPFTGISLGITVALGLALLATGLILRRAERQRD